MPNGLYERDFYGWANEQAALLRAGRLNRADIENTAEEIESLGRSPRMMSAAYSQPHGRPSGRPSGQHRASTRRDQVDMPKRADRFPAAR